jgi:hypothetical protein
MSKNQPAEFDAYDENYSATVNRALAFSRLKVDFFTHSRSIISSIYWRRTDLPRPKRRSLISVVAQPIHIRCLPGA